MNNPIHRGPGMQELRREIPFRSAPKNETNEGTSTAIENPDRMLSVIVLILACLGLAVLAHIVV
jgi:hypothetical protein